jgi:hypothetical protein
MSVVQFDLNVQASTEKVDSGYYSLCVVAIGERKFNDPRVCRIPFDLENSGRMLSNPRTFSRCFNVPLYIPLVSSEGQREYAQVTCIEGICPGIASDSSHFQGVK